MMTSRATASSRRPVGCTSTAEAVATPLSNTAFVGPYGLIEFEQDEHGEPVLVTAQAARLHRRL
jgi:hypothetical protein